jgi:hypothetical protein
MKNHLMHGLVALSVIALAACSDTFGPDGTDSPTDSRLESLVTLDVAMVAADALIEDVAELWLDIGVGLEGPSAAPAEAVKRQSSHVRTVTITFYDAEGNEQEAYDKVTTASVHKVRESSGERSRANSSGTKSWSSTTSRTRDRTITGLEGDETTRTANGTGSSTVSKSRHSDVNGDRSYEMTSTSITTDVVHTVPRKENPYPLSGTITRDVTVVIVNGRNGDETRTRHVVITFDGTQFAHITVNGESFEVDLSARDGRHPLRKRGK